MVKIEGEVSFPGFYAILTKEERISSLIERSGGLAPYAYVEGATLVRRKDKDEKDRKAQEKQLKKLKKTDKDLTLIETKEEENTPEASEYRVGINLKKIMENKNSYQDLVLKDGDVLIIPSEKQTVEVKGLVLAPSLVRYEKGKSTKS